MKESMRDAFLRAATLPLCSGDPGDPPGTFPGGYFLADIDQFGILRCCNDNRCASGYHDTCDRLMSKAELRKRGTSFRGAHWRECEPDVDEGSPLIRIILAIISGLGVTWLGTRWAAAKSLSGWTGPVLGVLTALLVLWLLRPRRKDP